MAERRTVTSEVVGSTPTQRFSEKIQNLHRDKPIPISSDVMTPLTATRMFFLSSRTASDDLGFEQLTDEKLYSPPLMVMLTFFSSNKESSTLPIYPLSSMG